MLSCGVPPVPALEMKRLRFHSFDSPFSALTGAQRNQMSDAKTALSKYVIVLAALIAVVAGGYFGLKLLRKPPTQPNVDVGKVVAEEFITNVRTGKAGQAWDSATAEFKSIEGRESFIRKVRVTPILKENLQFNSSQQVMIQDEPRTEYLFQSPSAKLVHVLIGFEHGNWKVDRLSM